MDFKLLTYFTYVIKLDDILVMKYDLYLKSFHMLYSKLPCPISCAIPFIHFCSLSNDMRMDTGIGLWAIINLLSYLDEETNSSYK